MQVKTRLDPPTLTISGVESLDAFPIGALSMWRLEPGIASEHTAAFAQANTPLHCRHGSVLM
jgi:hypothetical protein